MTEDIQALKRCAIYTRKSTNGLLDRDINSLTTQREICSAYVKSQQYRGWVEMPQPYDDGGHSGSGLERPALAQLMQDRRCRPECRCGKMRWLRSIAMRRWSTETGWPSLTSACPPHNRVSTSSICTVGLSTFCMWHMEAARIRNTPAGCKAFPTGRVPMPPARGPIVHVTTTTEGMGRHNGLKGSTPAMTWRWIAPLSSIPPTMPSPG